MKEILNAIAELPGDISPDSRNDLIDFVTKYNPAGVPELHVIKHNGWSNVAIDNKFPGEFVSKFEFLGEKEIRYEIRYKWRRDKYHTCKGIKDFDSLVEISGELACIHRENISKKKLAEWDKLLWE